MLRYDDYEYIYLTKHYQCGCSTLRPILRDNYERDYPMHHKMESREIFLTTENCPNCNAVVVRAHERKMERRGVAG